MCAVFYINVDIKPFLWYHKYIKIQNTQFFKNKTRSFILGKNRFVRERKF